MKNFKLWINNKLQEAALKLTEEDKREYLQFVWVYALLGLTSLVMTVVNIFSSNNTLMWSTLIFTLLCAINLVLAKKGGKTALNVSAFLFSVEITILFLFFLISGNPEGFSAIWIAMLPSSGLLLFGRKNGTIICSIMLAIMLFLFKTPYGQSLIADVYTQSFLNHFPILFIAFYAISFFLETVRSITNRELQKMRDKYQYLYVHDALTGLYNRYGFNAELDKLVDYSQNHSISFAIIDIDFFKKINDKYGHSGGDVILSSFAELLLKICPEATICRWGGEEFALLYKNDSACADAQKILEILSKKPINLNEKPIHFTVSIGVCHTEQNEKINADQVVRLADGCLYNAKQNGRNRVESVVYSDPTE